MNAFFKNNEYQFAVENALGEAYYRASDVGEVLATIAHIPNGDARAWVSAWSATADRVAGLAHAAESTRSSALSGGPLASRGKLLYSQASEMADATGSFVELWEHHRDAWDQFVDLTTAIGDISIDRIAVPYEDTSLPGYVFRNPGAGARRCLIYVNGSDGSVASTALARTPRWRPAGHSLPSGLGTVRSRRSLTTSPPSPT